MISMADIDRRIQQAIQGLRLGVQLVTDLVFDDDGTAACRGIAEGIGDSKDDLEPSVGWHFGFYSRPKDGARGVVLKADGKGNAAFLLAWRDKQYELSLEKGEVGVSNAFNAIVLLNKDGEIILNGGTKKVARFDDTAKADTLMATWMGQVETAINIIAGGSVAPLSSTFATTSVAKINQGADKVKA